MKHDTSLRAALQLARDTLSDAHARLHRRDDALGAAYITSVLCKIDAALEASKPTMRELFSEPLSPYAPTATPMPSLHFVIPTPPSSKNSKGMAVIAGRARMFRKREVVQATKQIQEIACEALRQQAPTCYRSRVPLLQDEDAQVEMVHNVANESVDVTVRGMGPRPKGRTGRRRDVVNLPELVLDAIQRIAFANDNQVADLRVWRNVGTPSTDRGASC
jgi:Holliday junction resolvase RusA-like endonuclease